MVNCRRRLIVRNGFSMLAVMMIGVLCKGFSRLGMVGVYAR